MRTAPAPMLAPAAGGASGRPEGLAGALSGSTEVSMLPEACPRMSPNVSLRAKALEGIAPEKGIALGALLAGRGVTAAAEAAGVSRRTITRWLSDDPDFISIYNSLKSEMHESIRQRLLVLAPKAVKVLSALLSGRATPSGTKLRAAIALLDLVASEPPEGPVTAEDAAIEVAHSIRTRGRARLAAGFGLMADDPDHRPILERIDPPRLRRPGRPPIPDDEEGEDDFEEEEDHG